MQIVDKEKLEKTLSSRWHEFADPVALLRLVREHVRDASFRTLRQAFDRRTKVCLSGVRLGRGGIELVVEFAVPKGDNFAVGTAVCDLSPSGVGVVRCSYGTEFVEP